MARNLRRKPKPKPTPTPTYTWVWDGVNLVLCFADKRNDQTVANFVEARRLSGFHDEDLQECTKELNATIKKYQKSRENKDQELAFLKTSRGLFLAWTGHAIGGEGDPEAALKVLGIRR